ncbi:MAG: hypothetical protein EOO43_26645 [Flavobacterium sp.]|nr:MAG: hypothetical protein EOO43_26645 [Flavobacterium sp.]
MKARERFHIENNECVNNYIPGRTKREYYEDYKDELNEYNRENKDKFWTPDKQKQKINYIAIDNSIKRLMQDDEFILRFINAVGSEKLLPLMGYEEI